MSNEEDTILQLLSNNPEGLTSHQVAEYLRIGRGKAASLLTPMMKNGTIEYFNKNHEMAYRLPLLGVGT